MCARDGKVGGPLADKEGSSANEGWQAGDEWEGKMEASIYIVGV